MRFRQGEDNRDHGKFHAVCNIVWGLLVAGLYYLMPYIAWHTMEGDKTDIMLGMVLGFVPIGLLLLSLLYGFLAERVIAPMCVAAILGVPAVFIPVVAGSTAVERLLSMTVLTAIIFAIVFVGTISGMLLCRLLRKIKS